MSPEFLSEALSDFRVGLFLHLRLSCFLGAHLSSWSRRQRLHFSNLLGATPAPLPGWICGEKWECSPRQGLQSSGGCLRFVEGLVIFRWPRSHSGIQGWCHLSIRHGDAGDKHDATEYGFYLSKCAWGRDVFLCGTFENHAFLFGLWRVRQHDADICGCSRTLDTCFQFWLEWGLDLYLWAHAVEGYRCLDLTPVCPPQIRLWKLLRSGHFAGADHSESQLHS